MSNAFKKAWVTKYDNNLRLQQIDLRLGDIDLAMSQVPPYEYQWKNLQSEKELLNMQREELIESMQ